MIRLLKLAIVSMMFAVSAMAEPNIVQKIAPAIHKVVIFNNVAEDDLKAFGTAFFARLDKDQVLGVTNNHICEIMIGHESFLRLVDSEKKIDYKTSKDVVKVKAVSMAMGQDLCFFSVVGPTPPGVLELGNDTTKLDKIIVVGYPGQQFNVIAEDGYVSDTVKVREPDDFLKCTEKPTNKFDAIMCGGFQFTLRFQETKQYQITPNIGPGFSGSPVVDPNGKVVGLIARYILPTESYTNGHGLFIPVSEIKTYAKDIELVDVKDERAKKYSMIVRAGKSIDEYLFMQFQEEKYFILSLMKGLLRESDGP